MRAILVILFFCGRNAGLIIAAVLALSWWFVPSVTVILLDANLVFVGWLGTLIGMLVPPAGLAIAGLLGLVGGLAKLTNFVSGYLGDAGPRSEATIRIIVETLIILGEVKIIRWSYLLFRLVTFPFRRR
jgi:hypothetical protein